MKHSPRKFKMWDRVRIVTFDVPRVSPTNNPVGRVGKIRSFYLWDGNEDSLDPLYEVWLELKPGETRSSLRGMADLVRESELELVVDTDEGRV